MKEALAILLLNPYSGERLEFDMKKQFPLLTTKKMFVRGIFEELMWFIRGKTDSKILEDKKGQYLEGKYHQGIFGRT